LAGATVLHAGGDLYDRTGDHFPYLALMLPDGTTVKCEISRDEEGNGPGWLFIADS
jgi:hypothetical protein